MFPNISDENKSFRVRDISHEQTKVEKNVSRADSLKKLRLEEMIVDGSKAPGVSAEAAKNTQKSEGFFRILFGKIAKIFSELKTKATSHSIKTNLKEAFRRFFTPKEKDPFKKSDEVKNQFQKFISSLDQEKIKEQKIENGDLKKLQKTYSKLKSGESKLVLSGGKSILVRKTLDKNAKEKSVEIHVIANKVFAKGTFGEVRGATSLSKGEERVVEKRARADIADKAKKASADIKNEYKILTKIHKKGRLSGIQAPPHTVVKNDKREVVGYIGHRYAGDGKEVVSLLHNDAAIIPASPQALIKNLTAGLKNLKDSGYYHFDHKLGNILYDNSGGKFDVVLSDFGGDLNVDSLDDLTETAYRSKDEKIIKSVSAKIFGSFTSSTTSMKDVSSYSDIISNFTKESNSMKDASREIKKFLESRIVFSQAVVSLVLLTGRYPLQMTKGPDMFIIDEKKGISLNYDNYEKFEREVNNLCKKYPVSKDQLKILYQSLSSDYKERPGLDDFYKVW